MNEQEKRKRNFEKFLKNENRFTSVRVGEQHQQIKQKVQLYSKTKEIKNQG
jgi:hypothetical protein